MRNLRWCLAGADSAWLQGFRSAQALFDPRERQEDPFFGDLEPVTAFAAVSALAQHMHCEMERVRHDETIQVLDVALLLQAFFDPIIVAAMLRTLQPRDLRDASSEPAIARTIRANMREYPDGTIAELALAAIGGKLPVKPVRELLEERQGDWARAYLELLEGY